MLRFHLNGEIDVSSRKISFIDDPVSWMTERFELCKSSRIIDFGCGPGLHTSRFAVLGADVCGVDFSPRSIAYARQQASKESDATPTSRADYLEYEPEGEYDLITMIMCDHCTLSPTQHAAMLGRFKTVLSENGRG